MEQFIEFIEMKHTRLPRRWLPDYIECYLEREVPLFPFLRFSSSTPLTHPQEEEFLAVLEEEEELRMQASLQSQPSQELIRKNSFEKEEDDLLDIGLTLSPTTSLSPKVLARSLEAVAPLSDAMPSSSSNNLLGALLNSEIQSQRQYLTSLLFQEPNRCITSSAQYDPNVRLELH
jgi:hypothetical protein